MTYSVNDGWFPDTFGEHSRMRAFLRLGGTIRSRGRIFVYRAPWDAWTYFPARMRSMVRG